MSNLSSANEFLHSNSDKSSDQCTLVVTTTNHHPSVNGAMQRVILTVPAQGTSSVPPQGSSNSPPQDNDNNFPSHLICVFNFEPPVRPVTYNIPDSNENLSSQVFEHADLYRFIATPGMSGIHLDGVHYVKHPLTGATVLCDAAMDFIQEVSPSTRTRIINERERHQLSSDNRPITQEL